MYLFYNGKLLKEEDLQLSPSNRAFQYNDGFFETLVLESGKVRYLKEHGERMQEAARTLDLELPVEVALPKLEKNIILLAEKNKCPALARVKLKVWRGGEGLYTPQTDSVDWLLTAQAMTLPSQESLNIGICSSISTQASPFSGFKGPNSLVYVIASREKKERNLEDLLLLDGQGHISELTYSNIFWAKGNCLYTPSLKTGCLNGVMRRNLLKKALKVGWKIEEGFYTPEVLRDAEVVFSSNVMGMRHIQSIDGQSLNLDFNLFQEIQQLVLPN